LLAPVGGAAKVTGRRGTQYKTAFLSGTFFKFVILSEAKDDLYLSENGVPGVEILRFAQDDRSGEARN
jgi:hypothetical protein